jgi:hypothetical protein
MNPIEEIKARLSKYPGVLVEADSQSVRVIPNSPSGFVVEFSMNRDSYSVAFEGWHENFADQSEAINCFAFGLSDKCRLKEYRRGNFAYKWTVEFLDGEWTEESTTGLLLFPFWRKRTVRYLQNSLVIE